jgi:curved DNA-binding protein CbpA
MAESNIVKNAVLYSIERDHMKENWEIHWKDYYEILQIHPAAEPEVVKAAYERLSHKYHPDHYREHNATRIMTNINEAYEIISNPQKRMRYNEKYQEIMRPKTTSNPIPPIKPRAADTSSTNREKPNLTDVLLIKYRTEECVQSKGLHPVSDYLYNRFNSLSVKILSAEKGRKLNLEIPRNLEKDLLVFYYEKISNFRKAPDFYYEVKKEAEIIDWLNSFRSGAAHLEICPFCEMKAVILNHDLSVGQCLSCDCVYAPEINVKWHR